MHRRENFYNFLTGKILLAMNMSAWNKSEMKIMKDHHNFYLKCGVLLLADVFKKIINNNLKNYGLCPCHYLSAPDLSWYGMLKKTKIKLELIAGHDMFIFFEKGTRGEIFYTYNRYRKDKNQYLKYHDQKQESKHILYLDANNLYGYAMSKFLQTNGLK